LYPTCLSHQAYSSGNNTKKDIRKTRTVNDMNSPDGGVTTQEIEVTCKITKETLNSFDFDVLEYSHADLSDIMTFMFQHLNLLNEFNVPKQVFRSFLNDISGRYINNTYHNYNHGCDVCHTTYRLIMIPQLNVVFTPLEVYALLVGALAHDVGHPGLNNLFLVKSKHALALQHNDRSPLENMHCVVLYEVLKNPESNIFSGLSDSEWRESRKIILTVVLGTDMSHHFEQISKTQVCGVFVAVVSAFLYVHGRREARDGVDSRIFWTTPTSWPSGVLVLTLPLCALSHSCSWRCTARTRRPSAPAAR
jgi:hypothetical protein